MKLKRYQQSAFFLQTDSSTRVAIDFGQEVSLSVSSENAVRAVFVSHQHPDHLHIPHLLNFASPAYAPADVVSLLESTNLEVLTVTAESKIEMGDLAVTFFNSDHGSNLSVPVDNLGMIFTSEGKRLLFLGDMAVASPIPPGSWDAILIPVGGSKVFSPEEAASFIRHLRFTGRVIPIHYHGRADPTSGEQFRALAGSFCEVQSLEVGEEIEL